VEQHDAFLRVRYADTDRMGVVYHSRYFEYFEVGRAEFMRSLGIAYSKLESEGTFLAVVEASARFRAPARYDDEIRIRTRIGEVSKARVRFDYEITPRDGGRVLVEGSTILACIDREGRPCRLPRRVLEALGAKEESGGESAAGARSGRRIGQE